jgi:hypothetical protein
MGHRLLSGGGRIGGVLGGAARGVATHVRGAGLCELAGDLVVPRLDPAEQAAPRGDDDAWRELLAAVQLDAPELLSDPGG